MRPTLASLILADRFARGILRARVTEKSARIHSKGFHNHCAPTASIVQTRNLMKMSVANVHVFKDEAEKSAALRTIDGWDKLTEKDAIKKTYNFGNFVQAFSFMTAVALESEKLDHHPEWFNVYNRVEITLNSHFCNGISKLDIKLAKIVDLIYEKCAKN